MMMRVLGVHLHVGLAGAGGHAVGDVDRVDGAEQGALADDAAAAHLEPREARDEAVGAVVEPGRLLRQPGVREALVDGEAPVWVDDEHGVNEIDCWVKWLVGR